MVGLGLQRRPLETRELEQSSSSVLLDYQADGAPLVVAFAAFNPESEAPPYEFFGRLRKLEKLSNRPINKLLLRDRSNSWYHYGADGLGRNAVEAAARLKGLVQELEPSSVTTMGQSMGAYGAVLYGALINADQVLAFGCMAAFDSRWLHLCSDFRWHETVRRVEAAPPSSFFQHLPQVLNTLDIKTCVQLYYGTKPLDPSIVGVSAVEAVNFDAVHAMAFAGAPRVVPHPLRWSVHRVPLYLREVGLIDEFLQNRILGVPYQSERADDLGVDASWLHWMRENYLLGFDAAVLLPQAYDKLDLPQQQVRQAFEAIRRNVLRASL